MLLALAWRNLLRNRRRSLLTASGMAAAVVVCSAMMTLMEGMYGQLREALIDRQIGHVQVHHPDWPTKRDGHDTIGEVDAVLTRLEALPGVRHTSARVFGSALLGSDTVTEGVMLTGVVPAREGSVRDLSKGVTAGAWLPDVAARSVVLGADLARKLEVEVGDELVAVTQAMDGSLGNELYTVGGVVVTGNPMLDRAGAFLHADDLRSLLALGHEAHEIVVVGSTDEREEVEALSTAVRGALAEAPALVRPWWEVDPTISTLLGMQQITSWIMLGFFFGISAVGVVNTLLMSVFERTRELGVMRALGLRPGELVRLVLLEALLLGALAVGVGLVLTAFVDAWLVTQGVNMAVEGKGWSVGAMTFDPVVKGRVTVASIVEPVLGVFFFSVLAGLWPAVRAARLEPVAAMREGQG